MRQAIAGTPASDRGGLRIGKLSRAANVHIETIRYCERIGLLPVPARTVAGYRSYSLDHLKRLGAARIRLTFHCEPCFRIGDVVNLKRIAHRRGYLGCFLNAGTLRVGDSLDPIGPLFEPIPYDLKERIVWYLERQETPVPLTVFLREVGLSSSYARAVPALLSRLSPGYRDLVSFGLRNV